jgi:hypothetical protein
MNARCSTSPHDRCPGACVTVTSAEVKRRAAASEGSAAAAVRKTGCGASVVVGWCVAAG